MICNGPVFHLSPPPLPLRAARNCNLHDHQPRGGDSPLSAYAVTCGEILCVSTERRVRWCVFGSRNQIASSGVAATGGLIDLLAGQKLNFAEIIRSSFDLLHLVDIDASLFQQYTRRVNGTARYVCDWSASSFQSFPAPGITVGYTAGLYTTEYNNTESS